MIKKLGKFAGGIIGVGMAFVMLFANQLGVDNNPMWSIKRYIVFSIGIIIFIISLNYSDDHFLCRILKTFTRHFRFALISVGFGVLVIYIWFVSIGLWTRWPNETSYYDMLATSFSHGQIALEVQPDPALLTLGNLYDPNSRVGIPMLWDATLFQGKYYLYWGPAPALFLTLVKEFYSAEIGDKPITFAFAVGTFVFMSLLLLDLWKKYFPEAPHWVILAGIAFAGLVNPIPYILIEARIYEAAIISAQFFLVIGLYCLFIAFNRHSTISLSLAGSFFALAVGTRTTLALPVAFLSVVVLLWTLKTRRDLVFTTLLTFALPLALGAISYSWYNYTRFGSIIEFGLRYQLTSYNLYESLDQTFSLAYIPPNLFKTLFNTLEQRVTFPYFFPTRWAGPAWLEGNYPSFYLLFAESITGILVSSPFMVFALLVGLNRDKTFRWISFALSGSAILIFFTLQIFFFTTMRYLLDLVPTLSILAVVGFWQGLIQLKNYPFFRWILAALGIVLILYTIAISLLLPVSGHLEAFRVFNPDLLKNMTWMFNNVIK